MSMTHGQQIIILLLIHWVADFLCQTKEMAMGKSTSNVWLLKHVGTYTSVYFIVFSVLLLIVPSKVIVLQTIGFLQFISITFVCHFLTDYFTSRWTKHLREKEKYYGFPSFFSVLGLDQFLHALQLILTYEYCIKFIF